MKNKIFIAIDTKNQKKALNIINQIKLKNFKIGYKFGLEFLNSKNGRNFISKLKNKITFGDYKFADIPNTCSSAIKAVKDLKFNYLTIHISSGLEALKAARKVSGIKLNDFNCGIKAYKNEVVKSIDVYGEMHRYIPLLAYDKGYTNINEKVVVHKPRKYGRTKFGLNRFSNGFLDLITLLFFQKFGKRPMHFFGLIGSIMILIGFISSLYLGIDKLYFETSGRLITDRPHFYVALTTMILGAQFFVAGFVGELIVKNKPISKRYNIISSVNS